MNTSYKDFMIYNLVFSIPVHEKSEVVVEQIININHYNENCAIVLHLSQNFDFLNSVISEDEFLKILKKFNNVYVNEERLNTIYGNIILTHISNFKFIVKEIEFQYFVLMASNEEFVRNGLFNMISGYEGGFNYQFIVSRPEWCYQKVALSDVTVQKICSYFGKDISEAVTAQVEGTFYKKNLFYKIIDVLAIAYSFADVKPEKIYPREEVYYQEIAYFLIEDKTKILKTYITHNARDNVTWTPYTWVIRRVASGMSTEYSVKRVGRELNHPTRSFIRNQCGHYSREVKEILPDTRDVPIIRIYLYDLGMVLKDILIKTMRRIKHLTTGR